MKLFSWSIVLMSFLLFVKCSNADKPNGWYFLEGEEETIGELIVQPKDFAVLEVDSGHMQGVGTFYSIAGKVKDDKIAYYREATEKAVGKQIGFLYNGEILSAPMLNYPIEGGTFSISSMEYGTDRDKMFEIYNDLKKEMK